MTPPKGVGDASGAIRSRPSLRLSGPEFGPVPYTSKGCHWPVMTNTERAQKMSQGFIPRIAFENEDDESTVYLALLHYARTLTGNMLMGSMGAVSELAHAVELIKEISENAHARQTFGPIPTDDDLSAFLDNGDENK